MKPLVSVIMLTHNRKTMVKNAIEDILNQSYPNFEFILIDNASKDGTKEICEAIANTHSKIKLLRREDKNISAGRNAGVELAKGSLITFVDDDDKIALDMLSFMVDLIEEFDAEGCFCGSTKEVEGRVIPQYVFEERYCANASSSVVELLKRRKLNSAMPTKMFKAELFETIKFNTSGNYDDITFTYKIFAQAKKIAAQGLPKYCFVRHQTNNSVFTTNDLRITPKQLDEYFAAFKERTEYLSAKLPDIADYALYSEWSYMISMLNKINLNNLKDCYRQEKHIREVLGKNYEEFRNSPYIMDFEIDFLNKYMENN